MPSDSRAQPLDSETPFLEKPKLWTSFSEGVFGWKGLFVSVSYLFVYLSISCLPLWHISFIREGLFLASLALHAQFLTQWLKDSKHSIGICPKKEMNCVKKFQEAVVKWKWRDNFGISIIELASWFSHSVGRWWASDTASFVLAPIL